MRLQSLLSRLRASSTGPFAAPPLKPTPFRLLRLILLIVPPLSIVLLVFLYLTRVYVLPNRPFPLVTATPTIYIVSHRRSGTHLSMDLLAHILPAPFRLVKTNHVYMTESISGRDATAGLNCRCYNYMRRTGKIIHAHRDVRDVVLSGYYYYRSFGARAYKNMTRDAFYANKDGLRDLAIESWVNTTTPFFAQDDVFQLSFADSVSGFPHVHDALAQFLGYEKRRVLGMDPRDMKSVSTVVLKNGGKGVHGYKLVMPQKVQDEVMRVARQKQVEKKKKLRNCPREWRGWSRALDFLAQGFWVGGRASYDLFAPAYCPSVWKGSKVVIRTERTVN